MGSKKKQTKEATQAAPTAPAARAESATPRAAAAARAADGSCEAALMRMIRLAHELLPQSKASNVAVAAASAPGDDAGARQSLEQALEGLDSETALKLRTLMIAGRDVKSISDVNTNMTLADSKSAFAAAALDASQSGPLLADYLRRGHALACATALDLERPLAGWLSLTPGNLDERAWLSFGKQLAKADPNDWQCLAFVDAGSGGISRLYLRLEEHAWWSFQSIMDRPSAASVEKQRRALSSRRSKGMVTQSLSAIVAKLSLTEGRALRRAARAIRARVGEAAAAT